MKVLLMLNIRLIYFVVATCFGSAELSSRTQNMKYEANSKSKVPCLIPAERIPGLSWQARVQLVH
jgi:hypothetical protein